MNTSPQIASSLQIEHVEPRYISEFWSDIAPGLWKAIRKSHGNERTTARVRQNLEMGVWDAWLVFNGNQLEGVAITEPLADDSGWWVNVPFAWSRGRVDTHTPFFEHLSPIARAAGAKGIKFISSRPGYERRAKQNGWRVRYKEYIVEEFDG